MGAYLLAVREGEMADAGLCVHDACEEAFAFFNGFLKNGAEWEGGWIE